VVRFRKFGHWCPDSANRIQIAYRCLGVRTLRLHSVFSERGTHCCKSINSSMFKLVGIRSWYGSGAYVPLEVFTTSLYIWLCSRWRFRVASTGFRSSCRIPPRWWSSSICIYLYTQAALGFRACATEVSQAEGKWVSSFFFRNSNETEFPHCKLASD
jgi:hypothetical protein